MAMTLQELNRPAESMTLLTFCREVFRQHDDDRRFMLCSLAEGVLLQRLSRFREARETYLLLLASSPGMDAEDSAALHKVIGICSIELRDYPAAESNLNHAIKRYQGLGQPIEVLRAQACLGRLYIRRGDFQPGITYLRPIRREFLRNAMHEEAGLCALDIIEGMLRRGKGPEAEGLARMVVREFTSAGLNARAITALGYLSEAIATQQPAPIPLVTNVREYILSLRTSPEREFYEPQA
jgi:tetratricopeptide (TPR) repeat protein